MAPLLQADVIVMDFTASGFQSGAPQDPVSGRMTWEAASPTATIENFLSFDLTIAGYTYAMSELILQPGLFNTLQYTVGGVPTGVGGLDASSGAIADFFLGFDLAALNLGYMSYLSIVGERRIWDASNVSIRIGDGAPQPVPEPASLALLGLGIAGLAATRRLQRQARSG